MLAAVLLAGGGAALTGVPSFLPGVDGLSQGTGVAAGTDLGWDSPPKGNLLAAGSDLGWDSPPRGKVQAAPPVLGKDSKPRPADLGWDSPKPSPAPEGA